MNAKQAKMLARMRVTRRDKRHWQRLPAQVKGRLRRYFEDYEPMVYPDYREALADIKAS